MKFSLAGKFALKNISVNKILLFPFIISSGIIISIFHVMISLINNDYVRTRHTTLVDMMKFGSIVIAIFSFIFIIYAKRFLIKRRNKEFAFYGILGLEKRHIRRILFIEEFITFSTIGFSSLVLGHAFGKLSFLLVNKLMRQLDAKLMDYNFSWFSFSWSLVLVLLVFIVIYIISILNIQNASPIELMVKAKKAEKEPKSNIVIGLIGILALGYGYYSALNTIGTMNSIAVFFNSVLIVILATYLLFIAFSIAVLKLLKKNKSFFYKTKNFLGISGMIYRMKANGAALATIAVLSTGVIISIASTISIYQSIEHMVETSLNRDYEVDYFKGFRAEDKEILEKQGQVLEDIIKSRLNSGEKIKDGYSYESSQLAAIIDDRQVKMAKKGESGLPVFLIVQSLDSYNKGRRQNVNLKDDEILVSANNKNLTKIKNLKFTDKDYKIEFVDNLVPGKMGVETYLIIVANHEELSNFTKYYKTMKMDTGEYLDSTISLCYAWNVENENDDFNSRMEKVAEENGLDFSSKINTRKLGYEFDGGFLFIGIIVGILFITATILITYYKQVTEAYEDRENYQIMKKVGLEDDMIKKTAKSQIIWMLFIPLIVALVHSFVASKIVYQLLGIFGIWSYSSYAKNMLIVISIFAVFYLIVYKITSRIYYKIVG